MDFTGERPTLDNGIDGSRLRYESIIPFCRNKIVYDYGCGIGHGSHYLSSGANFVIGYDHNNECITEAKKKFISSNLNFVFDFNSSDLKKCEILSCVEVIEHIEKETLNEILENMGENIDECIFTTPNGDLYKYHPLKNEDRIGFHIWHYTYLELEQLFKKYFNFVRIYGILKDISENDFTTYMIYVRNR